jgi:hypothetical protein
VGAKCGFAAQNAGSFATALHGDWLAAAFQAVFFLE